MRKIVLLTFIFLFITSPWLLAEEVRVNILLSSGNQRLIIRQLSERFEAQNPGITIKWIDSTNYIHHKWMETWEQQPADVVWWFAGYQLNQYAQRGSIEPIDDIWEKNRMGQNFPGLASTMSHNGRIYAIPLSQYQWGFYYKKSVFKKHDISEPKTWEEFIAACDKLKANKIQPLGLGTQESWTAASWFSYLNIRLNGLEFHLQLLAGKQSWGDKKVREVFDKWKQLIDNGYFMAGSEAHKWQGVLPFMYRDSVAMYLIGNFVTTGINVPLSEFGFFRFPVIKKDMPIYEESPTDVLFISRKSTRKASAKKFLEFMARPENQFVFNEAGGFISPHIQARKSSNFFINKGFETINAAKGTSQYFDRDTSKSMANEGFEILGDFSRTGDIDKAIGSLEKARKQHFPPPG
jgi:multiple sugar transport system substrate-binding protein